MGSGLLGTNLLAGHGFFGFDPTPNASVVNTVRDGVNVNGNFGLQPDTNAPSNSQATSGPGILARPSTTTGSVADNSAVAPDGSALGASTDATSQALYNSQLSNLNDLLGRTDTGLTQGLGALNDSYTSNVNQQQNQENQALQDYGDQRTATNKDKLAAYDTINQNANQGYRSLAQLIGRSSGTGSSAFQDLLPNVVGQDTSAKRADANTTYASNLGNIDTAQKKTENSFAGILADLANQRAAQEQQLRTGAEQQRQSILGDQQTLQAQQGNAAGVAALQPQIDQSRNAVESFFNQFKPTITAQQAPIAAPDLTQYQVDRTNVNAQNTPSPADDNNPYAAILRKQLQDQSL